MDLRIGTEEAGSDLKVPHNLPHCSPLSPFLFACISTQGNTWQIQEDTFSLFYTYYA